MQQKISLILNALSIVLILEALNFFDNLLFFIITGAVPGTSLSISPLIMLLGIIFGTIILSLNAGRILETKHQVKKATMPRKRYARL